MAYLLKINLQEFKNRAYFFANLLIVAFGFFLFVSAKVSTLILVAIFFLWVITGDFKDKAQKIFSNYIVVTFLMFMSMFVIGLIWTEDIYEGLKILQRPLLFLIVPLIVSMYKKSFLKYYLFSMLIALIGTGMLTVIHLNFFNIKYIRFDSGHTPFMNRGYSAGMLIFAYGYFLSKLEFKKIITLRSSMLLFFIILMVYSLVAGGARMGYINFFVATFIFLLYRFGITKLKILGVIIILVISSYFLYRFNSMVHQRTDRTLSVVRDNLKRTSLTCRFEFWHYAYTLGKKHFLLGVGTGDGILELERYLGKEQTSKLFAVCAGNGSGQFNPHNMYLFMFMQFGIPGVILLLWMLYAHFITAYRTESISFVILIVTTILTMFSNSELFSTRYFIPFYGYSVIVFSLIHMESKKDDTLKGLI
jgi:O-antigen ligase